MATLTEAYLTAIDLDPFVATNPVQRLSTLRTAKCAPYEIDLSDPGSFLSPPYRSAPPKMRIFSEMVEDLSTNGLVGPSKPPTQSPTFWCLRAREASGWWWIIAR